MQYPLIHLNGTSPERLLDDYCRAANAVRAAIEAVQLAAPNLRDYYPLEPACWNTAIGEHQSRMDRLRSVLAELEQLAEYACDWADRKGASVGG